MAAKLKAHNPQRAKLKSGGYIGEPTGETVLNENHKVFDVKTFANARVEVPGPVLISMDFRANGEYTAEEFGVDGFNNILVNLPFETKTVTPKTVSQDVTVTPDTQYQALEKVTVEAAPLEPVTITPTTQQQTITPQAPAIGFDSVTVEAPSEAIKNINLDAYIQGDLTDIVFTGTTIQANTFRGTGITSISMPNVTKISNGAFYDCTLLELSSLPSNLITIEANAFRYASKINFNYFPDNVTILGSYSFADCESLSNIIMPRNFRAFGGTCLSGCINLLTVDMSMVEGLATVSASSFNNTTCTFLFRDQAQLDAYAAATNWSALASRFQIKGA